MVTLEQVKELRGHTGCGVIDCRQALEEAGGDMDQAITLLRKQGRTKAAKKADRETSEGVVASYIHSNNKVGSMVSLLCETDFVARNEKFQELAHNIALHIAALEPIAVKPDDISPELVEQERKIALEQAASSGKPAEIQEKIVEGKLKTFRDEQSLMSQSYVKDPSKTIEDLITQAIQELGENITVRDFKLIKI